MDDWTFEKRDTVLVADFTFEDADGEDLHDILDTARELLSNPAITGQVTLAPSGGHLAPERMETIASYGQLAADHGVERLALVGEGLKPKAAKSNLDVPGLAVETFADGEDAIDWARKA